MPRRMDISYSYEQFFKGLAKIGKFKPWVSLLRDHNLANDFFFKKISHDIADIVSAHAQPRILGQ